MQQQKGAALIVVLSLLTVSLMVGLSSMQSSQIDGRLAGNYRAAAHAHMAAEAGASASLSDFSYEDIGESNESCLDLAGRKVSVNAWEKSYGESVDAGYYLIGDVVRCDYPGVSRSVVSRGKVSTSSDGLKYLAESFLVFSYPKGSGGNVGLILTDKKLELDGGGSAVGVDGEPPRIHSNGEVPKVHENFNEQANVTSSSSKDDNPVDEVAVLDPSEDDFYVDKIASYLESTPKEEWENKVTVTCDLKDAAGAPTRVVFCKDIIKGNLKGYVNNKLIVAVNEININPTGQGGLGNVSFVTSGKVDLGGMGSKGFKGVVWAKDKVKIKGNGSGAISGAVISKDDIKINGGPDLIYDPEVFGDLDIEGVVKNPFDDGSGGSSSSSNIFWLAI